MSRTVFIVVRTVLAAILLGSLFVQVVMVPLLAIDLKDLEPAYRYLQIPLVLFVILGIVTVQVAFVCVWHLVTMARRGTVFSSRAFRYVDVIIGAAATAAALTFGLGVFLAPGEAVAPGVVLLIGGAGVLIVGIALIVLVLRMLLAQAVARDTEAKDLRAELNEVI